MTGLWRKTWLETRTRFLLAAAAMAAAVAVVGAPVRDRSGPTILQTVFGEPVITLFLLIAITLGGGSARQERAHGTLGFTLALPVTRPRLAIVRAAVGTAQLAVIVVGVVVTLCGIVVVGGTTLPWAEMVAIGARWVALGAFLVALSTAASTLIEHELVGWLATFSTVMLYEAAVQLTPLRGYSALELYRFAGAYPGVASWAVLATLISVTCVCVAVASWQLGRSEP